MLPALTKKEVGQVNELEIILSDVTAIAGVVDSFKWFKEDSGAYTIDSCTIFTRVMLFWFS